MASWMNGVVGQYNNTHYNGSIDYLMRLGRRWEDADFAKIQGDPNAYFQALETIYRSTFPFYEKDDLEIQPEDCDPLTAHYGKELRPKDKINAVEYLEFICRNIERLIEQAGNDPRAAKKSISIGVNECDRFRMFLTKLLYKHGIIYFKREKAEYMDEIASDYGISPKKAGLED